MDSNKDYYKILGVLDDAEDIVIKAAYRALAQKYHPDKFQGSAKTAKDRMQEINESYGVLSDPTERKKYDGSRKKQEYEQDNSKDTLDLLKTLEKDWKEALGYFEDLNDLASQLSEYSKQLEYTFKVLVIEKKNFKNRFDLAVRLKKQYLIKYFGSNAEIQKFAEALFQTKDFGSLKKLNKAVNWLGSDVDPEFIINKINYEINVKREFHNNNSDSPLVKNAKILAANSYSIDLYTETKAALYFLEAMGADIVIRGFWNESYYITYRGEKNDFTQDKLISFARKEAITFLKRK